MSPSIEFLDSSLMFVPALLTTSYNAWSIAFWTPESDVLDPATSSVKDISLFPSQTRNTNHEPAIRGSIRGVRVIKVPKAFAALDLRTSLDGSAKDFAKVR